MENNNQQNLEPQQPPINPILPVAVKKLSNKIIVVIILAMVAGIVSWIALSQKGNSGNILSDAKKTSKKSLIPTTPLKPYSNNMAFCDTETISMEQINNHQTIGLVYVKPVIITATEPSKIEVSAEVGDSATLLPDSVELLRFDDKEKVIGSYGKMQLVKDKKDISRSENIYNINITLNEPIPEKPDPYFGKVSMVILGVTAEYQGINCKPKEYIRPGGHGVYFIMVYPPGLTAQETILKMADYLDEGNFAEAQKLLPDKPRFRHNFDGLSKGDKNITEFTKILRTAKFKEGDEERQVFTIHFNQGLIGDWSITLWRNPNGWNFEDDFPGLSPYDTREKPTTGYMNNSAKNPGVFGSCDMDDVKCVAKLAFEKKDPELCAKMGSSGYLDTYCYMKIAPMFGDTSLCKKVDEFYKPQCIQGIASKHQDPTICEQVTDLFYRKSCYEFAYNYMGEQTGNIEYCKKAGEKSTTSRCYNSVAIKNNNIKLCDYINTQSVGLCYVDYAVAKKDCSLLPNSVTLEMKKGCQDRLDHPELYTIPNEE